MSLAENLKPIWSEFAKYVTPERLQVFIEGLECAALVDFESVDYSFRSLLADIDVRGTEGLTMEFEDELRRLLMSTIRKYQIRLVNDPEPSIEILTQIIMAMELVFTYNQPLELLNILRDQILENKEKISLIVKFFFDIDEEDFGDNIDYVSDALIERFVTEMEKRTSLEDEAGEVFEDEELRVSIANALFEKTPAIQNTRQAFVDNQCGMCLTLESLLRIVPLKEETHPQVLAAEFVFLTVLSNTPLTAEGLGESLKLFPFTSLTNHVGYVQQLHQWVIDYANQQH